MLGPLFGGWGLGLGLQVGIVGFPFWVIMVVSSMGAVAALAVYEGDGHELKLEGDDEDEMAEKADVPPKEDVESTQIEVEVVEWRGNAGPAVGTP